MATFKCPDCKGKVSTIASACPKCGRPVTNNTNAHDSYSATGYVKWIIFIFFVLAIIASIGNSKNDENKKNVSDKGRIEERRNTSETIPHISSLRLVSEYKENTVSADIEWKNKYIVVTGIIDSITKSIDDFPVVVLYGVNDFQGVRAKLDIKETGVAASLLKGRHIFINGKVTGMTLGSVSMTDCIIVDR